MNCHQIVLPLWDYCFMLAIQLHKEMTFLIFSAILVFRSGVYLLPPSTTGNM